MNALFPDLIVNGETVPSATIAAEAQNHTGPQGKPGIAWRKAANAVALRTLLLQRAQATGIDAQPQEIAPGKIETPEEALIRGLLDHEISVTPPTADAVRAEWARDPDRFRAPPLWEVSHILIACDPRDSDQRDAARQRAQTIAQQAVGADARGFARLAEKHSDCPSKSTGGALGQLGPGDTVPEFETALRPMDSGQITPAPVLTRHGWHVIRMDAVAQGAVLPFDAVAPKIAQALEKAAWAQSARQYAAKLVADAQITGADFKPL